MKHVSWCVLVQHNVAETPRDRGSEENASLKSSFFVLVYRIGILGVDGNQATWFSATFQYIVAKMVCLRGSAPTPLWAYSATPAGKRWVTPLQRAPQYCGPQGPEPHDPPLCTLLNNIIEVYFYVEKVKTIIFMIFLFKIMSRVQRPSTHWVSHGHL